MNYTHNSYQEAQTQLKRNKRNKSTNVVTWDAGDGWTARGYWCTWRNRIITETTNGNVTLH